MKYICCVFRNIFALYLKYIFRLEIYLKCICCVIAPVLTNIFNACISTGYFPKVLKTFEVVPIFKNGERELCSNYRPISILNPFAKLFEKSLLDQLNNYFVSNNLISPNQYGFKKNCSTNEAILDIYNKLPYLTIWIKSSLHVLFS